MKLPEVHQALVTLSMEIGGDHGARLFELAQHIPRRRPTKRAAPKARRMTPEIAERIRALAANCPDLSHREIGAQFNVDGGRVSEVLAGFRR